MTAVALRKVADDAAEPRVPPHSIEAEQALLGALLLDNEALYRIRGSLDESDFYLHDHRLIVRHAVRLIEGNKSADVVTLYQALRDALDEDSAPRLTYLNALAQNTPSAAGIQRYAEIVRAKAALRRLVAIADEIAHQALRPGTRDPQQLFDELESKVFAAAAPAGNRADFIAAADLLTESLARVRRAHEGDQNAGCRTGLRELDRMVGALEPGQFIIIGGRPSMGKTSLALNIAEHVALAESKCVAFFSMEMSAHELLLRLQSSIGGVDQQRLKSGALTPEDFRRLATAVSKLETARIYIDESPALTAMEVRAKARRLARRCGGLDLVVIDYLQLMSTRDGEQNRANALSEVSRALKALGKELQVPVVALSQLNRRSEDRADRRPAMADLRESGGLEQDADIILLVYREATGHVGGDDKGTAEVIVAKQRNGPVGTVRLRFDASLTRFDSIASG